MTTNKVELSDLLRVAVESYLCDMHTCLPAIVESYDRAKQTAVVQPALKRKYTDGNTVNLPIIHNVPVCFPRSGEQWIHFDLKKGDVVTLFFSERSIDRWKELGGVVSPDDRRKFSLSDAYAIPGGYPKTKPISVKGPADSIEIGNTGHHIVIKKDGTIEGLNETGQFKMNPEGKFTFTNGTNEFVSLMSELLQELIAAMVYTGIGPQPFTPDTVSKFTVLKTKLDTLKE